MKPLAFLTPSTLILAVLIIGCNGHTERDSVSQSALRIVNNPSSSFTNFELAVKLLATSDMAPSFWLKIASNARYTPDQRRRCVRQFFDGSVSPGMRGGAFLDDLGGPANWISYERIVRFPVCLVGWTPATRLKPEEQSSSMFYVPILFDREGNYHLLIVIAFKEQISLNEFVDALKGQAKTDVFSKATICGCRPWDSEDEEYALPGSTHNRHLWQPPDDTRGW
jgi:hypothetical protein